MGLRVVLISARELLTLRKEPRPALVAAGLSSEEET